MNITENLSYSEETWKCFEVGVLYQYVNCFSAQREKEESGYGFVTVSMMPSSSFCEIVMKVGDQEYDCEYVYPGDNLIFLGQRTVLPGKALTLVVEDCGFGGGWDNLLCFLHPGHGKVVACDIGDCFFWKISNP